MVRVLRSVATLLIFTDRRVMRTLQICEARGSIITRKRSFICHHVPRSCVEVPHWYRPLLTFGGEEVVRAEAAGGGPCGETQAMVKGPH